MAENTKIEWAVHTWNPWIGCSQISPACDNCYAMVMMDHRYGKVTWGSGEDRIRTSGENWKQPYRWNRAAAKAGRIDTVFCLSLGDIWDNEVDPLWRRQAFEVMNKTPNLVYLLLSKRIGNAVKMCDPLAGNECLPGNAALGATMVNQDEWDRDIQKLKDAGIRLGAKFTFASIEPMLGPINMRGNLPDWVIVGGESGRDPRPMNKEWPRSIRDQCADAGVPYLFKQWGEYLPVGQVMPGYGKIYGATTVKPCRMKLHCGDRQAPKHVFAGSGVEFTSTGDGLLTFRVGKTRAGRLLDGVQHDGFPAQIAATNNENTNVEA